MRIKAVRAGSLAAVAAMVLWTVTPSLQTAQRGEVTEVPETVTYYGSGFGALGQVTPSGQDVAKVEMRGLAFAAGRRLHTMVRAADGTLLMAGMSHNDSHTMPTSGELVIGAYPPGGGAIETIRLSTSRGRQETRNADGYQVGATVSDLLPLPGGQVAFTAWPARLGQDTTREGVWPVFGILSKTDDRWQVARQWTPAQLGAPACALDCLRPQAMALLPASGDIIVAHAAGALTALRITGTQLRVTAHLRYPLPVGIQDVQADPTGVRGRERFVIGLDSGPGVVQEFSYDSRGESISVASAPVLPGDLNREKTAFFGYQHGLYDRMGNLWVSRRDGARGGTLAVYTQPLCGHDPKRDLADYRSMSGDVRAWGLSCPPDYDILQAKALGPARGMVEEPATGTVVMLADGGALLAVRSHESGTGLTFEIGNVVDLGHKLLASGEHTRVSSELGAIDIDQRLWFPTARIRPGRDGVVDIDHLMVSVKLDDLFNPPPIKLPGVPGRSVVVQAEHSATTATVQRRGRATVAVDSAVYVSPCTDWPPLLGCGYDGQPGNGFRVADDSGFGHLAGSFDYRVRVPAAGYYRLTYRAGTFKVTTTAEFELIAGGRIYRTPVHTAGDWRSVPVSEPVFLGGGVQTITLRAVLGRGGWYLNSFTLVRA